MKKREPLYDFGLSQEDVRSEIKGLDIQEDDHLLCIASAGEIPLNIAALKNVSVTATDISLNQIHLCKLKRSAAIFLDPALVPGFLGYMEMKPDQRLDLFIHEMTPHMEKEEVTFWEKNIPVIKMGVIHEGRFERFIKKAAIPALWVMGRKNLERLFECKTTVEQEEVFDKLIAKILLKLVFKAVFHPAIYKKRGISEPGLQHQQGGTIGSFFFQRFRDFCCSTPARENFLLQYIFFRRCIFPEALPEYLKPENREKFLRNAPGIRFIHSSMSAVLKGAVRSEFNKIQLSNISDWLSKEETERLFMLIREKTTPGSRITARYIYSKPRVPARAVPLVADPETGRILTKEDRFPFFSIETIYHTHP